MMHGHEKSDPVIVAMKPTNNTERSAAEPVEPRTGTKGNVRQRCLCRAQYRVSGPLVAGVHTAGFAVDTRGGRSYGAGGGGRGTFIAIRRWRLPRGTSQRSQSKLSGV
jgi:hypothetical protein